MTIKSVLIVGEDDLIAWAIRKRFSAMQIPSRVVATPDEALAELRKNPYCIVVFDPGLLETEGPGGIEKFRRISGAAGIRIAEADEIGGNRLHEYPETDLRVFEKPLTICDLDWVVERVAGRFSEKRGNRRYTCNIPLRISFIEEDTEQEGEARENATGIAAEVAEAGLRIFTQHPLTPGRKLRLSPLVVHDPLSRFIRPERNGEVVWVVPDEEGVIAGLRYLE